MLGLALTAGLPQVILERDSNPGYGLAVTVTCPATVPDHSIIGLEELPDTGTVDPEVLLNHGVLKQSDRLSQKPRVSYRDIVDSLDRREKSWIWTHCVSFLPLPLFPCSRTARSSPVSRGNDYVDTVEYTP